MLFAAPKPTTNCFLYVEIKYINIYQMRCIFKSCESVMYLGDSRTRFFPVIPRFRVVLFGLRYRGQAETEAEARPKAEEGKRARGVT